jgi:hypothetical protein
MTRLEAMAARISTRSFDGRPLSAGESGELSAALVRRQAEPTLSGKRVRLTLARWDQGSTPVKLGTYGLISGVSAFIVPAVERGEGAMEDLGWALEAAVLDATALGISTCWIGGLFSRSAAAGFVQARGDEIVPALIALGHAAARRSLQDRIVTGIAKSRSRRPRAELVQGLDHREPGAEDGRYREALQHCLEAVRIAPSASNKQPWRLVVSSGLPDAPPQVALWLDEDRVYNNALGEAKMQRIDMGIAMRHFAEAAAESGFPGAWQLSRDLPAPAQGLGPGWIPVAMWRS